MDAGPADEGYAKGGTDGTRTLGGAREDKQGESKAGKVMCNTGHALLRQAVEHLQLIGCARLRRAAASALWHRYVQPHAQRAFGAATAVFGTLGVDTYALACACERLLELMVAGDVAGAASPAAGGAVPAAAPAAAAGTGAASAAHSVGTSAHEGDTGSSGDSWRWPRAADDSPCDAGDPGTSDGPRLGSLRTEDGELLL